MANQTAKRLPAISDERVLRFCERLGQEFSVKELTISVPVKTLGNYSSVSDFQNDFPEQTWSETRILSNVNVTFREHAASVQFTRPAGESVRESNICLNVNQQNMPEDKVWLRLMTLLDEFTLEVAGTASTAFSFSGFEQLVAQQISQLSELHTRIVHDAEQSRLKAADEMAAARAELDRQHDVKRAELEAAHASQLEEVAKTREALSTREKALDDRGHMHARRELREKITTSLKERLERPQLTRYALSARRNINLICLTSIVALVGYAGYAAWDMHTLLGNSNRDLTALAVATIRFGLPVAAATGLVFYLLNWWRRVHSDDLRVERDLERYRYDIDRATWIVETILEARSKEGGEVPVDWIHGVTQGLFARGDGSDPDHEAMDALAALLGVSARAELGPGGTKFEIKRDGLKRLARSQGDL